MKQPEPIPDTITLTVGTAGHIDHGKTQLIKLLTGCDTDRLPEEKSRGMTIDLGFATCTLTNNRRVGIVDVPGHERFIHNMVAGATGIDAVLLVVAADDGVMPQTVEHFHIVRLLGVTSGMVAITKIDLVPEERVEEVEAQVCALIEGSFLEACPVTPISSKTGAGFDGFYDAFAATVDRTAERDCAGPFRLHVERNFVLKGLGVIVSGIPRSGAVRPGDGLELLPSGARKKVRGVQVYGQDAEEGRAGECVALRMADLSREEVERGAVLATPGHFSPSRFVNARFHLLAGVDMSLKPRTAIRLHVGTADAPGHLVLPELTPMAPGTDSYVQFQLSRPVVAAPGDFFVVRLLSPVITIGGGYVVQASESKMRRTRGDWEKSCEEFEKAFREPRTAITYVLSHQGAEPTKMDDLARMTLTTADAARAVVAALVEEGVLHVLPGDRVILDEFLAEAQDEIVSVLNGLHDERPLAMGFPKKELFPRLNSTRVLTEKAMERLAAADRVRTTPSGFQLPERAPTLSPSQAAIAAKILETYKMGGFATPRHDELPQIVGAPGQVLEPILQHLTQKGDLIVVSEKVILHRDLVEESRQKLLEHFKGNTTLESGDFKNMLGTSRKYSIPLLEYWDAHGLTRRTGNQRVLREKRSGQD